MILLLPFGVVLKSESEERRRSAVLEHLAGDVDDLTPPVWVIFGEEGVIMVSSGRGELQGKVNIELSASCSTCMCCATSTGGVEHTFDEGWASGETGHWSLSNEWRWWLDNLGAGGDGGGGGGGGGGGRRRRWGR